MLGTVFDGIARHTREGYAFQGLAAREGFRTAVRERDEPFGDLGPLDVQGLMSLDRCDHSRHPRAAAGRRSGADRGGRLRRRHGDRDRRPGRGGGGHAVPALRLQGGAVRGAVPVGLRPRGAGDAGGRGGRCPPRRRPPNGLRRCWRRSPRGRCASPRLAWALIAEPVDPLVDAERLAYRERYAALIAEQLRAGSPPASCLSRTSS